MKYDYYLVVNEELRDTLEFKTYKEALIYARQLAAADHEGIAYIDCCIEDEGIITDILIKK